MKSNTQKTTFWYQLKEYGYKNFFLSFDFVISIVILLFLIIDKILGTGIFLTGTNELTIGIIATASTLFAITLASLAIIFSFSSSSFVSFLKEKGKLSSILFLFWSGNISYLITIVISFMYLILGSHFSLLKDSLYILIIPIFLYSLINTFYLLATVIRFGHFLDLYDSKTND